MGLIGFVNLITSMLTINSVSDSEQIVAIISLIVYFVMTLPYISKDEETKI